MKMLQKICFVLLMTIFLSSCSTTPTRSSVYVGSCWDEVSDVDDCRAMAEQGDASAQYNLGRMYFLGQGVIKDYKESFKWYRKAAEQGYAAAQTNLGFMYQGVRKDYKQAVKWFRKSAEQGDVRAQLNLGAMYVRGLGVRKNYVMAHMYWNIAAVSGDKTAIKSRDSIEKKMTSSQIEKAQDLALEWMRKHQ